MRLLGNLADIIIRSYIPFLANIGVLSLLAWVVSVRSREVTLGFRAPRFKIGVIIGVSFGATAALLMNIPIEIEPGIFGDGRAVPILLSGIFGGPVAAILAGGLAAAMRYYLGGGGMYSGLIYIAIFAAAGIVTFWFCNRRTGRLPSLPNTLLITVIATGASTLSVLTFSPESRLPILLQLWPQLLAANLIGVAILGGMLHREYSRRTAEVEMERQRERADSAARAKSRFLTAMSHEIRTPLNAILGIHQILAQGNLPEEARERVKTAQDAGQFLLALINQILDFAKIEAGAHTVRAEPFSVTAMMNALQSIFHYQAGTKGIALRVAYDGDDNDVIVADRNLLQQVLFNLIGNAIKFTNEGSVQVRAYLHAADAELCDLRVEVQDTGPGISKEDRSRIFGEFEQTSAGESRGGTGLGLAISKKITGTIGAQLTLESEVGVGSCFALALRAPKGKLKEQSMVTDNTRSIPATVLLVEDNAINQEIAKAMLMQDGHVVHAVSDGQEALEFVSAAAELPDIVFMDIQMPILDGVEATRRIRKIHSASALPIIALSANAFSEQQAEYLAAGMNAAISKPIQQQELRACIRRFASTHRPENNSTPESAVCSDGGMSGTMINPAVLEPMITVMGPEKLGNLVQVLKTASASQLALLKENENDSDILSTASHDLKGMYANFGLVRAAKAAENLTLTDSEPTGRSRVDLLAEEAERSFVELEALIDGRGVHRPAMNGSLSEAGLPT